MRSSRGEAASTSMLGPEAEEAEAEGEHKEAGLGRGGADVALSLCGGCAAAGVEARRSAGGRGEGGGAAACGVTGTPACMSTASPSRDRAAP
eukprot:6280701-Alexandrium_andersonii.AAC.1